jgi:hypothetical protein
MKAERRAAPAGVSFHENSFQASKLARAMIKVISQVDGRDSTSGDGCGFGQSTGRP